MVNAGYDFHSFKKDDICVRYTDIRYTYDLFTDALNEEKEKAVNK